MTVGIAITILPVGHAFDGLHRAALETIGGRTLRLVTFKLSKSLANNCTLFMHVVVGGCRGQFPPLDLPDQPEQTIGWQICFFVCN
jgi:hypothetical protein